MAGAKINFRRLARDVVPRRRVRVDVSRASSDETDAMDGLLVLGAVAKAHAESKWVRVPIEEVLDEICAFSGRAPCGSARGPHDGFPETFPVSAFVSALGRFGLSLEDVSDGVLEAVMETEGALKMRGEIMLYLSKSTFSCVWYLSAIEPECIVQIASHLTRHGYPPREKCTAVQLNIIVKGIAARSGDLLHIGDTWGDDIILTSTVLRDTRLTTTLTYVEVQSLTRELTKLSAAFPTTKPEFRRHPLKPNVQAVSLQLTLEICVPFLLFSVMNKDQMKIFFEKLNLSSKFSEIPRKFR